MFKMKAVELLPGEQLKVVYNVTHCNDTSILEQDLTLVVLGPQYVKQEVKASMDFEGMKTETADEAILKMADWCERMAISLKKAVEDNKIKIPF